MKSIRSTENQAPTLDRVWRRATIVIAGAPGVLAFAGAIGLVGGGADLGAPQVAVIQQFNLLHVVFGAIGVFLVSAGWRLAKDD